VAVVGVGVGVVGAGVVGAGVVGVGVVDGGGAGLEAGAAGVQSLGFEGPRGTPFEQAAIVIAGNRKITNLLELSVMTRQGWNILTGMRSPVDTMAAAKPLSAE
jgi:hypothetical protein